MIDLTFNLWNNMIAQQIIEAKYEIYIKKLIETSNDLYEYKIHLDNVGNYYDPGPENLNIIIKIIFQKITGISKNSIISESVY